MKLKQILASTLILSTLSTSVFASPAMRSATFEDISGHWAEKYIESAVSQNFFSGKSENLFAPEDTISRAEFVVVMVQLVGAEPGVSPADGPWFQGFYETAKNWFLIPDSFTLENLDQPVTREEIACTLIKTVGEYMFEEETENSQNIPDFDSISDEYTSYVTQAYKAGLLAGMDAEGNFAPTATAKRGQAATVVVGVADKYFSTVEATEYDNELSQAYSNAIIASRGDEENANIPTISSFTSELWPYLQPSFGFDATQVESFSLAASTMNIHAYCVAVVKPVEGQEDAVLAGLEAYKAQKINEFTNYLADQLVYAENAVIETLEDGTMILVMGSGSDEVLPKLKENIAAIDLTSTGGASYENDLSKTFALAIDASRSEEEVTYIPTVSSSSHEMWPFLEPQLGFTKDQVEGFSVATSGLMVQAYGIVVVKPVTGEEEAIIAGLEAFKEKKASDFEFYLMDQYEYAKNAVIETLEDGTIIFVMGESAETVLPALKENLATSVS